MKDYKFPLHKSTVPIFIYLLVSIAIAYRLFGNLLFNLNTMQLDRSGDGFKNYFSFAYQFHHGKGQWFEGMQYPFGDLLSFADGQPAVLFVFRVLKMVGLDIKGHELMIIQGLPILGLFLGAFFLHKIMRSFGQTTMWTVISVSTCLALSPQLFRFNSHFALAYVFCFASIWYFLIRVESSEMGKIGFVLTTSALLLIYGFIHPYHLLMGSTFLFAFFGVKIIQKNFRWDLVLAASVPIVIYLCINGIIDPYSDRPQNPWGAWHYKTELSDMLPFYGWFKGLFGSMVSLRNDYHEGYVYLGALLFIAPVIFLYKKYTVKGARKEANAFSTYFYASVLVLLFSMGVHMLLTDKQINEWIPTLKQFRALGRFSWPFFYVAFLGLAIYVGNFIKVIESKSIRLLLMISITFVWLLDAYAYTKFFNTKMNQYKAPNELYQNTKLLDAVVGAGFETNNFQAVLPLPIPTEGAEKFSPQDNWFVKTEMMPYSFQTGTPFVGGYMSRMSLSRILMQHQLGASNFVKKEALEHFNSDKDLIIVVHKSDTLLFEDILKKSYTISKTEENRVYGISIKALTETEKISQPDSIILPVFYNNYSDNAQTGLFSKGNLFVDGAELICNINSDSIAGKKLDFSIWYRIDEDKSNAPLFSIKSFDATNRELSAIDYNDKTVKRMEVIGQWVQLRITHDMPLDAVQMRWSINAEHLTLDHALITVSGDTYFRQLNDAFGIYNHFIGQVK